jgi:hypothetical protein
MSSKCLSVGKLIELARTYPAQSLPVGIHQSYPILVPSPVGLRVEFLYCNAGVPKSGEGYQLWPPRYAAVLQAETGKFLELRGVKPKDFGQSHAEDKPIGTYLSPAERTDAGFLTKHVQWCQAFDVLLGSPELFSPALSTPEKTAVAEFKSLFAQIGEKALLPYYHAAGTVFFDWLRHVK